MAKADGVVTGDEVQAFEQLFEIPPGERAMSRGCSTWPSRTLPASTPMRAAFGACSMQVTRIFEDIVDGLFHIAKADGDGA